MWTVAGAKAKLSELIKQAHDEPQTITKNGEPSVIVVSVEEWKRKTARKGSIAEFLLSSPLRRAEIEIGRDKDQPRELDL